MNYKSAAATMRFIKPAVSLFRKLTLIVILVSLTSACGLWKKDKLEADTENLTAEQLYGEAKQSMLDKKWIDAVANLQKLEARYPYGKFAIQAQLDTVYSHYKADDNGLAIAAADRFLSINPTHPSADYAYHIKGLASFDEEAGLMGTLTGRSNLVDRDQKSIVTAIVAFKTILSQYANSDYAFHASQRIAYLESALAEHDISVAKFYFERSAYVATVNRCKAAIESYPERPQVEDALGLMLLSYKRMGMADLASDTQRILSANYPKSGYLTAKRPKKKRASIAQAFKAIFN
ncbi:MAG: outer membrane protein assembly factor BamD [Saprospiraceae bacterium]|jgi:outer membrane protein assembly factor BamD